MGSYACIKAIAGYLPEKVETNDGGDRFIKKIGISERHVTEDSESAGDLAVAAAERLFAEYPLEREKVDFLLLCTQHPDYQMPTTACNVQHRLGLSQHIGALDFNLGCSGYVYGLSLVKGLIETGMAKNVLLLTSSVYTKYINRQDATIRPLFGDGATATLITAEESDVPFIHSFVFGTDGSRFDKLIIPVGGSRNTPQRTPESVSVDERGNRRSNYEAYMDGTAITYFTLREVPPLVDGVLDKAGLVREDIDYYVFHQANKFMLEYVQKKCKLKGQPFYNDIDKIGNTVSGTIPFGLEAVLQQENSKTLQRVMLAGFGVGLSWAGCIVDLRHMLVKN